MSGFLTGVPDAGRPGFRNTISLDQFAAEHIGDETRFSTLALSQQRRSLSWTRSGAMVPADSCPSSVFARLFLEGRPDEVQAQVRRSAGRPEHPRRGRATRPRRLQSGLGADDRDKLDEYFTSVRELEQRLAQAEEWSKKPKPKVDAKPPKNIPNGADLIGKTRLCSTSFTWPCRPTRPGSSRCNCWARAACRRSRACRWAITTCRTTARTRTRSRSSRSSSWKR